MLAATNAMDPKRDGTLCSSIDRHTECYILCENFALEIIIVLRTDARKKKQEESTYLWRCECVCGQYMNGGRGYTTF